VNKVTGVPHKEVAPIYKMIWINNLHSESYMATQIRKNAEASLSSEVAAEYKVTATVEDFYNDPQNVVPKKLAEELSIESRTATNE
jgi:hypothetical protein